MLIVDRRSDPVPWPASESEALFRQDPREPEVRDHAGIEARQGGDTAARERYHHETRRAEHPTGGVARIERQGGLSVRSGRDQTASAGASGDDRVEPPRLLGS